jgi:hypothetical protein
MHLGRIGPACGFALVLVGLLAGCGGGSDNGESTAALTKAEFLKQGNAVCREGNEEIQADFEEFAKEKGLSEHQEPPKAVLVEGAESFLIPAIDKQIEGLRALGAPKGDEGEVDQLLTAAEKALEEGEADPASLTSEGPGPFAEVNREAAAYGLTACAEGE